LSARPASARLRAELYALTHRGNPGDLEFYLRRARGARRVLELGSGSGRLLLKLAHARRELVGLDCDPEMLVLARRDLARLPGDKRAHVRLVRADMRSFVLKSRYQRVFLPYNALYCLLNQRDAVACFRAAHSALEPGGELVLDVWNAAQFHGSASGAGTDEVEPIAQLEHRGDIWDVLEHSRVRRAAQRIHAVYEYVPRTGGHVVRIEIPQRYYLAAELRELLARASFEVTARYGDFSEARYTPRSPHLILVARAR
jgi:SAM-dependent methyltransferase